MIDKTISFAQMNTSFTFRYIALLQYSKVNYRMAEIYCHINQCNASVQYFAILHSGKYCKISEKPTKLKIRSL